MNAPSGKLLAFFAAGVGIAVFAVLYAQRARAQSAPRRLELVPLNYPDGEVRIDAPPLEIPGVPFIAPPEPAPLERLGRAVVDAVDQVKDALKGLGLWSRKVPEQYRALFAMAGANYRLPPGLLEAVAYRESRYRDDIISGKLRSKAGAVGIMQIVPKWHPDLGEAGALNPLRAVPYAARYLRQQFEYFGSWKQALAAYNWGPGNQRRDLEDKIVGDDWPRETREYVAEISANAGLA